MPAPAPAPPPAPSTGPHRSRQARAVARWQQVPAPARHVLVNVTGWGLILLGLALIVVPGPLTIPPLLAGLAILATEYRWARRTLTRALAWVRRARAKAKGRRHAREPQQ